MPAFRLHRAVAISLAVATFTFSSSALAWGPEGHAIIADIASLHLTPVARAQVQQLLALEGHAHLGQIASWPDEIRKDQPSTGPWHYVDIPLSDTQYRASRDCPHRSCVVARIPYFEHIVADPSAAPRKRLRALKFLVHFVGDIQQPLHAEDHHDKGGNEVEITYFGQPTNLHRIWDGAILERALHLHLGPHYSFDHAAVWQVARKLDARITPAERAQWAPGGMTQHLDQSVVEWANQSHQLARSVAYADLPKHRAHGWSAAYQARAWPVVRTQLQRGGVRLAAVLNAAFH